MNYSDLIIGKSSLQQKYGKVDPLKIRIIVLHHKLAECEIQFANEWTRF